MKLAAALALKFKLAEGTEMIHIRDIKYLLTSIMEKLNHKSIFCSVTGSVGHIQECMSVSAGLSRLQCLIPRLFL